MTLEFLARVRGGADAAYRDLLVERFQLETSKKVRALSHGNRQKVQLIAAFASRAELLILDEPTGGLDPLMEMAFRETVREAKQRGQTVFLSSRIPQRGGGGLRSLERIGLPFPLVAPEFAQPREGHIGVSAS